MTLLIFDCDGVLVDSEVLALDTLREMMASLGRPMTMAEADREFTGGSLADTIATAERLLGRPIPADIGQTFGQRLLERFRRELKPISGVRDAILALPYRLCVASSSSPERLRLALAVTGLARCSATTCSAPCRSPTASPPPISTCSPPRRSASRPRAAS